MNRCIVSQQPAPAFGASERASRHSTLFWAQRRTRRKYAARSLMKSCAASGLAGLAGFGSVRRLCARRGASADLHNSGADASPDPPGC